MILHEPFKISARLLPALKIGEAWLSWDGECFFLDTPEFEHVIDDLRPGRRSNVQSCFAAILSFMDAAAESRKYRERKGREGENEDLFPAFVVDWICDNINEVSCMSIDLEEGPQLIEGA